MTSTLLPATMEHPTFTAHLARNFPEIVARVKGTTDRSVKLLLQSIFREESNREVKGIADTTVWGTDREFSIAIEAYTQAAWDVVAAYMPPEDVLDVIDLASEAARITDHLNQTMAAHGFDTMEQVTTLLNEVQTARIAAADRRIEVCRFWAQD